MGKIAVVYGSKYGTVRQYAQALADAVGADLLEASKVRACQLENYQLIIFGGGLYAGGILGKKAVALQPAKKLLVFTVGMTDVKEQDYYRKISEKHFPGYQCFHLPGVLDYSKLSLLHRGMMWGLKSSLAKKSPAELSAGEAAILEGYGKRTGTVDLTAIKPIVEAVKNMKEVRP